MGRPESRFSKIRRHSRKGQYDEYLIKIPRSIAESYPPLMMFECFQYPTGIMFCVREEKKKNG